MKKIKRKEDIGWHVIIYYLRSIDSIPMAKQDKIFMSKFHDLESYVQDLVTPPDGLDILDTYVITEFEKKD